ncbi:MAG: peptidoglycan DD-metalloendopeptidase family protein [Patescibacteria group bacterium]
MAFMLPRTADASIFSYLSEKFSLDHSATPKPPESRNSQTIPLLEASIVSDFKGSARGGGDIVILDENALLPDVGPSGTIADIELNEREGRISLYVVRKGDTLSQVAKMYGVDANTIAWANDLDPKVALKSGQTLIILPINGVQHVVKKGDTIENIARKYGGSAEEIRAFNDISAGHIISIGDTIIIPDGKEVSETPKPKTIAKSAKSTSNLVSYSGYYTNPLPSGKRSQGIHGYNGIDMSAPTGSTILASATGRVLVSNFRTAGNPWFGGYGNYVVIEHSNGTQTLYAHMSAVYVSIGARVEQGQPIGEVGNTGRSTGSHLHFEVRGAKNPF